MIGHSNLGLNGRRPFEAGLNGRRPPETGGHLKLLQRHKAHFIKESIYSSNYHN